MHNTENAMEAEGGDGCEASASQGMQIASKPQTLVKRHKIHSPF